jgi:hypothetical protein
MTSKFAKNANMTQKIIFSNYLIRVSKNTEFDAEFKPVEKEAKKFNTKKAIGLRSFVHSTER